MNKLLKMFYFAHCSGSANANSLKPDQTVWTWCVLTKQYFFKQVGATASFNWWWESWLTGIVLQRQSVWNVCGQWWQGHDASPRSIQELTPVFVPCCTWSWPSHMPSRSHYSDCPLWQKLKVPAKRKTTKHISKWLICILTWPPTITYW